MPKKGPRVTVVVRDLLSDGEYHLREELVYALRPVVTVELAMRKYRRGIAKQARHILKSFGRHVVRGDTTLEWKIRRGLSRYLTDSTERLLKIGVIERGELNGAMAFRLNGKHKAISAR